MDQFTWASADAYERYVGRWSREIAALFLRWLRVPPAREWLDVGCGTGALTSTILAIAAATRVRGYDLSPQYVAAAREWVNDPRVEFQQADATELPDPAQVYDAAVSGLVLNFVPNAARGRRDAACGASRRHRGGLRVGLCRGDAAYAPLLGCGCRA